MRNKIHHITYLLDRSTSMTPHRYDLVKVVDDLIRTLAEDSKNHPGEETRVSVFMFSSPHSQRFQCLLYDMDVLHVPSISGLYVIDGGTALCDAVVQVLEDLALIPEKYGEHFHLVYLVSDGEELHSTAQGRLKLPEMIRQLPANVTLGAFTPSITGKHFLMRYGFAQGNISVWDPTQAGAALEAGIAMASATTSYMSTTRSGMAKSVSNLFTANAPSAATVTKGLVPLTPGSYYFETVTAEDLARITNGRIDQFMELKTGKPYSPGLAYYEFTKRERVQGYKKVLVAVHDKPTNTERVYGGENARSMLGLPTDGISEVRVSPGEWNRKGYRVFILSTSNNRKLVPGTRVLVMR